MFKRKLVALDYHNPAEEFGEVEAFRQIVVWLEDQKIRHYKIEDRAALHDTKSSDWDSALQKYLQDLGCPVSFTDDHNPLIDWLLGLAVRLEYGDNLEKYRAAVPPGSKSTGSATASANPLDSMDFNSPEFKAGVSSLAALLQIPPHPDHLVVLKAISVLVKDKLSKESLQKKDVPSGPTFSLPLDKVELGFQTSDYATTEAAKILRLLHIKELRELQSFANEAIVAVQALTANPKTDTKLGKVGQS